MKLPLYQVDAFAAELFQGNPAAVCPLQGWPADHLLQQIAAENNLSETAFFVQREGQIQLRWFTPTTEVGLCGHATLATAHVLYHEMAYPLLPMTFTTLAGALHARCEGELITIDLPACYSTPASVTLPLKELLGIDPEGAELWVGREDLLVVLPYECDVLLTRPDFSRLAQLHYRCTIVTALAEDGCDFVSRVFAPRIGVNEDPVTGSAHCQLAPFWQQRLGKNVLTGRQLSARGGLVRCEVTEGRVALSGTSVTYLKGEINIEGIEASDDATDRETPNR